MDEPQMSRHHRKCRCHQGSNSDRNISVITQKKHRAWHTLFSDRKPEDIADYINNVFLDPDFQFVCVKKPPRLAHDIW